MAVEFTITNQQHEWLFDANGNRFGQWTISFQTPSGVVSQIIVPDDSYTPEAIAPIIAREVQVIEDVQHITHAEPAPHRPHHVTAPTHHHRANPA